MLAAIPIPGWKQFFVSRKSLYCGGGNEVFQVVSGKRVRCGFWTLPSSIVVRFPKHGAGNNTVELFIPDGQSARKYLAKTFADMVVTFNGHNGRVSIGETCKPIRHDFHISVGTNATVIVGRDFCTSPNVKIEAEGQCAPGGKPAEIVIDDGVLIASDTLITNDDHHAIIDVESDDIINYPKDIRIGGKCWICQSCLLLKGTVLPAGTILGARSVCAKAFEEKNCVIVGNPPRIVRRGVRWTYENIERLLIKQRRGL